MKFTSDIAQFITETLGFQESIYGEIITSILVFLAFIVIGWIVYHLIERVLTGMVHKTKTKLDDEILKNIKKPIYFFVLVAGLFYGLEFLSILQPFSNEMALIFSIIEVFLIAFIITRVINVFLVWYSEKQAKEKISEHILVVLRGAINFTVYLIAFFYLLFIYNVNLTGAVVGFGVGGIAIAFALQNILSDFFSAFTIYFDKPFEIGDFVVIGDYSGTVKKIGMKSTRINLLQGEELVMANKEITSTCVRNFKKMRKRRISFSFGVTYDTPLVKLKKIPEIIKKIINSEKLKYVDRLDRVHFTAFGDFSLNFDVVYYLKTKDYVKYMDAQQEINFKIKEAFEKEGIEMAFPTQTIFLNK